VRHVFGASRAFPPHPGVIPSAGTPRTRRTIAALTSAFAWFPQTRQRKVAWLIRLPAATCPHLAHSSEEFRGSTLTSLPQAIWSIERFNPAFAATPWPGWPFLPRAERVRFWILRSSTTITPWLLASWVVTLLHQSFRRRAWRPGVRRSGPGCAGTVQRPGCAVPSCAVAGERLVDARLSVPSLAGVGARPR
jgi:hypothetical protein